MKTPESAVLRMCLVYLRMRGHFVFRVNNGAFKTERGGFLRSTDLTGVADIIGVTADGRGLAVECKSTKGRLSDSQKAFGEEWERRGALYVIARNVEDLQEAEL